MPKPAAPGPSKAGGGKSSRAAGSKQHQGPPASIDDEEDQPKSPRGHGGGGEGSGQQNTPTTFQSPGEVEPADRIKFLFSLSQLKEYRDFVNAIADVVSSFSLANDSTAGH